MIIEARDLSAQSFIPLVFGLGGVILALGISFRECSLKIGLGMLKVLFGLFSFFVGLRLGLLPMGSNGGARLVHDMVDPKTGQFRTSGLIGVGLFAFFMVGLAQVGYVK